MAEKSDRLKSSMLRMALKAIPDDMLKSAPAHLERYLNEKLQSVEPEGGEASAAFLITPQRDGTLAVITVTLDENNKVSRIIAHTDIPEIFQQIIDNLKAL